LDAERQAVHIWDCSTGELRELAADGGPAAAWHPTEPVLMVAGHGRVARWHPAEVADVDGIPLTAAYTDLAFSPDGQTLWASPSSAGGDDDWESSDVIDLASGAVGAGVGPQWDTAVVAHPGGGPVLTFRSDQGATLGIFARVEQGRMRLLDRALILDCDGYEPPVFSADGRHLAIRGNSYDNSVEVFELPSLHRVFATTLGDPSPGYPYPQEWLDRMNAWSRHNLAFAGAPGTLWIATPDGTLVEAGLDDQHAATHEVLSGRVTALAATATGELVVAGEGGELLLVSVPADAGEVGSAAAAVARAFLDTTTDLPDGADLWESLVMTDGSRSWTATDVEATTTADETDPTWLRIQAAVNNLRPPVK
jgi:WD40 repeat protein